jgi:hypothetical protein
MSVVIIDGRVAVGFLTAVATLGSPTVAEVNAGTRLETLITPTGLVINPTTGAVDVSALASKATAQRAGRVAYAIKLTIHHDGTADTAYNLLPYRTNGFLWVRRGIDRTQAVATNDKCEVYAIETGEPDQVDPAPSGVWDFSVDCFLTEAGYASRAVVA